MVERSASGECFVQVGVTALRDAATGEFLPSTPIYIKVDAAEVDRRTQLAKCEIDLNTGIADVLAQKFCEYVRGCKLESAA